MSDLRIEVLQADELNILTDKLYDHRYDITFLVCMAIGLLPLVDKLLPDKSKSFIFVAKMIVSAVVYKFIVSFLIEPLEIRREKQRLVTQQLKERL